MLSSGAGVLAATAWPTGPAQAIDRQSLPFADIFGGLLPPEPVFFPRPVLDQRFAVLLLRSGYEATDALDWIPMDKFQVAFWKYRQSQQEGYNLQYAPQLKVPQGDVTSPLYFDFISHSQYAVIARNILKGEQVFEEFCEDCPNSKRLVRRDPAYTNNALLPAAHQQLVGEFIFTGLRDGFRGEEFGGPAALPTTASQDDLLNQGVQPLLDVMVSRGFALKARVVESEPGRFTIRTEGPANLWSVKSLLFARAVVVNTYDALAVSALLRASGKEPVSVQTTATDTALEHTFILSA